jgi:hypothetical protein
VSSKSSSRGGQQRWQGGAEHGRRDQRRADDQGHAGEREREPGRQPAVDELARARRDEAEEHHEAGQRRVVLAELDAEQDAGDRGEHAEHAEAGAAGGRRPDEVAF